MSEDELVAVCLTLPGTTDGFPFGDGVHVLKVVGKMFALVPVAADPPSISLKCDPELSLELRAQYEAVTPGYHLNKRHWNTIVLDGEVPEDEVRELIDHSYELVRRSLPKRVQAELDATQ